MPDAINHKNNLVAAPSAGSNLQLIDELKKANLELREARRAALNLMEDAIAAKEALRKSEEKYRTLFNSIDEGFSIIELLFDEKGNVVDYRHRENNPVFTRMTGIKNPIGKRMSELVPDLEPEWHRMLEKIYYTGEPMRIEYPVEQLGQWYRGYLSRMGGEGSPLIACVYDEITERKHHEQRQAFLNEISKDLLTLDNIADAMQSIGENVAKQFKLPWCNFAEMTDGSESGVVTYGWNAPEVASVKGAHKMKDLWTEEQILKNNAGELTIVADTQTDPRVNAESYAALNMRSFIVVPLVRDGKFKFMIAVADTKPRQWRDDEIELAKELTARIWARLEKARADESLQQSEERFRTLANAVPQVIWSNDEKGIANYFNQRWYDYSGLTYEQSVGLGWEAIVHPDDAPASKEKWQQALAAGEIFDTEYRLRRRDGQYRWFIGRNVPLKDAAGNVTSWFGSATDIEDLKKAQEAFSQSEAKLRITMESATDYAIITMDTERKIERWSSGAVQIFGYTEEEVIGKPADLIFTDEDRAAGAPQMEMETARDHGRAADERWHQRKDGSRFFVSGFMRPIYNKRLTGYVKVARDMTQQKLFTEELSRLVVERTLELQQSNESLQQFATIAAHDLQEPLRKVRLFSSLLQRYKQSLPHEGVGLLVKIDTTSKRMSQLIREVLEYSRIAYRIKEVVPTDLDRILQNVLNDLELQLKETDATIIYTEALPEIDAVPLQMNQLFYNLLTNALKFRREGAKPVIQISFTPLSPEEVKAYADLPDNRDYIEIIVADNGIGFDEQFSAQIFQIFERLHSAEEFEGTGVGLALCKKIVENLRGRIFATSKGEGASFVIILPVHQ